MSLQDPRSLHFCTDVLIVDKGGGNDATNAFGGMKLTQKEVGRELFLGLAKLIYIPEGGAISELRLTGDANKNSTRL